MLLVPEAKANHILGGELTYVNVSANTYKFTLTIYRDCSGEILDPIYYLNYKSTLCGVSSTTFPVNQVGNPVEVSIICPSKKSTCNGGGEIGIQKQIYTGTITLPKTCTDWVISWDPGDASKRNSAITNIVNPINQKFYIEAKINNSKISSNNSPSFSGMAFSYLFIGQKGTINTTATDIDGNDLTYKITTPKTSATATVSYLSGFSAVSPISTSTPATFNNSTGELTLSPKAIENSVTAIIVEEYKDGEFIGSVTRDLQIITLSNTNTLPTLSGINNTSLDSMRICAGDKVDFKIYGSDIDVPFQNLTVSWNNGISLNNNSFDGLTTTGALGKDTTSFKWETPSSANGLYTFTVNLKDDYCPIVGATSKTYKIRVFPKPTFNLANDTTISCADTKILNVFNLKGKSPYQYVWDNGEKTSSIKAGPGNYKLTITDANNCFYQDSISIKSGIFVNFKYDSLCAGSPTNFTDLSNGINGSRITKWNWNFGDPTTGNLNSSSLQNPTHQFPNEGSFNVKLIAEDDSGCIGDTTLKLHLCAKPLPDFEIVDTCKRKPATMKDLTAVNGCSIKRYEMTFVQQVTQKVEKASYDYPPPPAYFPGQPKRELLKSWLPADSGTYKVTMVAINENGCRNSIQKNVYIRPQPIVVLRESDYAFRCNQPDTALQVLDTATVKSKLPSNKSVWEPLKLIWKKYDELIYNDAKTLPNDSLKIHVKGNGFYAVKVTDMFGCDSVESVNILKKIDASFSNRPYCTAGQEVKFLDYSVSNLEITSREWDFGDGNSTITAGADTSVLNVKHLYGADGIYTVKLKLTNESTCTDTASIKVLVNTLDNTFRVGPSPVCLNSPVNIKSRTGAYIDTLYWTFGDGVSSKISQNGMTTTNEKSVYNGTHTYTKFGTGKYDINLGTLYNKRQCYVTDKAPIELFPELKVKLSVRNLCAHLPTRLEAERSEGNKVKDWKWNIFYQDSNPPYLTTKIDSIDISANDAGVSNQQIKTFTKGGNYFIDLKATNTDGCDVNIKQQLVRILDLPTPFFCADQTCATLPTKLSLFCGNKPEVSINKYLWEFPDDNSTSSTPDSTIHTFKNAGTFNIKMTIENTFFKCTKSATQPIEIKSVAFPAFIAEPVCLNDTTKFLDKSYTLSGDEIVKWSWNFGEQGSSTTEEIPSPKYLYTKAGKYNVTLSVTNKGKNCTKDFETTVVVHPNPTAGFSYDMYNATAQKVMVFKDSSSSDVVKWLYDFGDGSTKSTKQHPDHTYKSPLMYPMKQLVTNQFGCTDSITKNVDLKIYMLFPTGFSPNGDAINNTFYPILRGIQKIDELKLYNRWGELLWETSGEINETWDWKDHSWDGTYQGVEQPMGVYIYYARAKSFIGDDVKVEGKVTIIR